MCAVVSVDVVVGLWCLVILSWTLGSIRRRSSGGFSRGPNCGEMEWYARRTWAWRAWVGGVERAQGEVWPMESVRRVMAQTKSADKVESRRDRGTR
ncbi:hypothetical protein GGR57DRAFT_304525 [Xylariaceae sp. FL1272]|nr:hypothetical protein GGR57DRAFT_304525 [Xylariaceae sp. FL1272]